MSRKLEKKLYEPEINFELFKLINETGSLLFKEQKTDLENYAKLVAPQHNSVVKAYQWLIEITKVHNKIIKNFSDIDIFEWDYSLFDHQETTKLINIDHGYVIRPTYFTLLYIKHLPSAIKAEILRLESQNLFDKNLT